MNNLTHRTHYRIGGYRAPRRPGQMTAAYLSATLRNGVVDFTGGAHGRHSVLADDLKRVNAHWIGYVKNTRPNASPRRITKADWSTAKIKTGEAS
jgi:hypothetical protein